MPCFGEYFCTEALDELLPLCLDPVRCSSSTLVIIPAQMSCRPVGEAADTSSHMYRTKLTFGLLTPPSCIRLLQILEVRHGALMGVSELLPALKAAGLELSPERVAQVGRVAYEEQMLGST